MTIYILLFFFLLILFLPIPIKIKFIYKHYDFMFYIYNFKINIKNINKKIDRVQNRPLKDKAPKHLDVENIKYLFNVIKNLSYKPKLKFRLKLDCGLDDSAYTAVAFGYLHLFFPVLYNFLSNMFNLKHYKIDITPVYNKLIFETYIESIFSINIAKLIYIFIKIMKAYKNIEKSK